MLAQERMDILQNSFQSILHEKHVYKNEQQKIDEVVNFIIFVCEHVSYHVNNSYYEEGRIDAEKCMNDNNFFMYIKLIYFILVVATKFRLIKESAKDHYGGYLEKLMKINPKLVCLLIYILCESILFYFILFYPCRHLRYLHH